MEQAPTKELTPAGAAEASLRAFAIDEKETEAANRQFADKCQEEDPPIQQVENSTS